MDIKAGKFYQMRNGRLAYVAFIADDALCTHIGDKLGGLVDCPAVGYEVGDDGVVAVCSWCVDGRFIGGFLDDRDLVGEVNFKPAESADGKSDAVPDTLDLWSINGELVAAPTVDDALTDWMGVESLYDAMGEESSTRRYLVVEHNGTLRRRVRSYVQVKDD